MFLVFMGERVVKRGPPSPPGLQTIACASKRKERAGYGVGTEAGNITGQVLAVDGGGTVGIYRAEGARYLTRLPAISQPSTGSA